MHNRLPVLALVLFTAVPALAQARRTNEHWVTTWATAVVARPQPGAGRGQGPGGPGGPAGPPQAAPPTAPGNVAPAPAAPAAPGAPPPGAPVVGRGGPGGPGGGRGPAGPPLAASNQTIRQIVHVSVGGSRVRAVLSNTFGTASIEVGAADIALRATEASVQPQSVKPLTVNGNQAFTILPGATVVTDPVDLVVPAMSDLAIDLYLPGEVGSGPSPLTTHNGALQTSYVLTTGNNAGVVAPAVATRTGAWMLLARVEVTAPARAGTIVTFGDSITDGTRSTADTNARWPDVLARRLVASQRNGAMMGIANEGIAGNRLLGDGAGVSALARFDRDVLLQTGTTHIVVLEGINDIGIARNNPTPTAQDLIGAHRQMIERAHAQGIKIIGATLTPFEGAAYFTPEGEAKRAALNEWIRTSGTYDGVIDFDKATRDPNAPTRLNPLYDSGDHLHPNDAGYKAMGESIDLALFK